MATIECKNLSKSYGPKQAVKGIDLVVEPNKIVGLLGPNGSGKTTLLKMISGLLTPTFGEIFVCGMPIGFETKGIVSYLPDKSYLNDWMTVEQLLQFFASFYPDFRREVALDMVARLSIDPRQKLKSMSKGTKEKVQLILVMSREAKLYLLDEPIGGVDPAARDYILDTIINNYATGATVIISTHLISDIEKVLDEVIFIANGTIALQANVDEVREREGKSIDTLFREVYKC